MKFDKKLIDYLGKLSRVKLTNKEKLKFQKELSAISDFASIVQKVKSKAEPLYTISQEFRLLRDDKVRESLDRSKLLKNTHKVKDGQIKVKSPFDE